MSGTEFRDILTTLVEADVKFVLIGGLAAMAHGSARATLDVDVVYERSENNIQRLSAALAPLTPYLRGAPPGLPFVWEEATITNGLNFTLSTTRGDLDLFGEVTGGGDYDDLLRHSLEIEIFGITCHCVKLERLIYLKRAAGRPKDLEVIAELQILFEEQKE